MAGDLTDDLTAKLKLLEEAVGHKASYRLLDPFPLDSSDAIQIQAAARRIAEFVGLGQFTFIVGSCRQKENVGGHIDMHPSGEAVFIEMAPHVRAHPRSVLALLAHEITHKYLQINAVSIGFWPNHIRENEILTDVASVWLGLGKLVLNGCETESRHATQTPSGRLTTTTRHRLGYLSKDQFAFVYLLVCTMRAIPETEFRRSLTSEALDELRDARQRVTVNPIWGDADGRAQIGGGLKEALEQSQRTCASISRDATLVRKGCVDAADSFLVKSHSQFKAKLDGFEKLAADLQINPSFRFLHNVELHRIASAWESEVDAVALQANEFAVSLAHVVDVVTQAGQPFRLISVEMLSTITCPQDGTVLRVPPGRSQMRVRCSVCGYDWLVETVVRSPNAMKLGGVRSWINRLLRRSPTSINKYQDS
jgi:hypothetical protein